MELRHLRYFLAVAEELHFGKAAERLNISQPPLSRQVRGLETELGAELFERSGRRVRLTRAGEHLQREAATLLERLGRVEREVRILGGGMKGHLTIGYTGSLMFAMLPELLSRIGAGLPGYSIELQELATESQLRALLNGRLDLGFVRNLARAEGLNHVRLTEETLSAIFPRGRGPAGASLVGLAALATLAERPFVTFTHSWAPGLVERVLDVCTRAGFSPRIAYECSQFYSVLRLVAGGLGWSIVPTLAARNSGLDLDSIELVDLPDRFAIGIAYSQSADQDLMERIVAMAKAVMEESPR
jgi:DNA-binding transcriptional LysR family regulator